MIRWTTDTVGGGVVDAMVDGAWCSVGGGVVEGGMVWGGAGAGGEVGAMLGVVGGVVWCSG